MKQSSNTNSDFEKSKLNSWKNSRKSRFVKRILLFATGLLILLICLAMVIFTNMAPILTVADAQEQLDASLESVFAEADPDNFLVQMLNKTVTIKVKSVTPSKDGWYADCIVTSLDLATPIFEYIWSLDANQVDTYTNAVNEFQNQLVDVEEIQQEFRVEFQHIDGAYQIVLSEEMVDFCSGNLLDVLPYLLENIQGGGIG